MIAATTDKEGCKQQAARKLLRERRQRDGSHSYRRNNDDDGSNCDNRDCHRQRGARGAYKCDGHCDNQPNGKRDANGGECGRRHNGDDSQVNAPKKARCHRKQERDFVRQEQ